MADMYGVKQLRELGIYVTVDEIKDYAKEHGLLDEHGEITKEGENHISYKYTKYGRYAYIAITEELANKI